MILQLIRIGYNHDTGRKFGNLIVAPDQGLKKYQLGFSLKIEVPQLGLAPSQLGLTQAKKFQLELISTVQEVISQFESLKIKSKNTHKPLEMFRPRWSLCYIKATKGDQVKSFDPTIYQEEISWTFPSFHNVRLSILFQ